MKVDEIFVGLKGNNKFFETRDFLIDSAAPSNLVVQLGIRLSGKQDITFGRLLNVPPKNGSFQGATTY